MKFCQRQANAWGLPFSKAEGVCLLLACRVFLRISELDKILASCVVPEISGQGLMTRLTSRLFPADEKSLPPKDNSSYSSRLSPVALLFYGETKQTRIRSRSLSLAGPSSIPVASAGVRFMAWWVFMKLWITRLSFKDAPAEAKPLKCLITLYRCFISWLWRSIGLLLNLSPHYLQAMGMPCTSLAMR